MASSPPAAAPADGPAAPAASPPSAIAASPKTAGASTTTKKDKTSKPASKSPERKMATRPLRPAPYYYYVDHSRDADDDALTPLTPALSVPNFVTKLHAILTKEGLDHIVGWMPHGRSWKIHDQAKFVEEVLPMYYNQSSIASFYRQANGWGFRRMLRGPDKGSFYNERFLRGLPFLCKTMKRIGGAKMIENANINHEPTMWKISAENPLPEALARDSLDYIVLDTINKCVAEGGPKAKMPFVHAPEAGTGRASAGAKPPAVALGTLANGLALPSGGLNPGAPPLAPPLQVQNPQALNNLLLQMLGQQTNGPAPLPIQGLFQPPAPMAAAPSGTPPTLTATSISSSMSSLLGNPPQFAPPANPLEQLLLLQQLQAQLPQPPHATQNLAGLLSASLAVQPAAALPTTNAPLPQMQLPPASMPQATVTQGWLSAGMLPSAAPAPPAATANIAQLLGLPLNNGGTPGPLPPGPLPPPQANPVQGQPQPTLPAQGGPIQHGAGAHATSALDLLVSLAGRPQPEQSLQNGTEKEQIGGPQT